MRCMIARFLLEQRQFAYCIYTSEAAKIVTENTMRQYGGSKLVRSFGELVGAGRADNRTGDEIAQDVVKRAGLVVR